LNFELVNKVPSHQSPDMHVRGRMIVSLRTNSYAVPASKACDGCGN